MDGIDYPLNDLKLDAMESVAVVASSMTIAFPKTCFSFIHGHTSNSIRKEAQNHSSLLDQQLVFVIIIS